MKTYSRLDAKHIHSLIKGKSITLSKKVHDGGGHIVELHFNTKKKHNLFHRNLEKGKGTRIKPCDLDDVKVMNGQGFFDSLKNIFNSPVTKGIAGALAPVAGQMAGAENPIAGAMAQGALKGYAGSGVRKKKGGSFFDTVKAIAKPVAKALAPQIGNAVSSTIAKTTGNSTLGNVAGAMTTAGLQSAGSGIRKKRLAKASGGAIIESEFTGIGGPVTAGNSWNNSASMADRMAFVRAHRKKGGSFGALGT